MLFISTVSAFIDHLHILIHPKREKKRRGKRKKEIKIGKRKRRGGQRKEKGMKIYEVERVRNEYGEEGKRIRLEGDRERKGKGER